MNFCSEHGIKREFAVARTLNKIDLSKERKKQYSKWPKPC